MKNYDVDYIVKEIAHKLENYEEITRVQTVTDRRIWDKLTLSHGLPGICMLFGTLMEGDEQNAEHWEAMGRQYMGYIVEEINHNGITNMSLYSGLSGVGLAAACLSKDFVDYKKLLAVINKTLSDWIKEFVKAVSFKSGTHAIIYDVIAGMTGVLSYLSLFPNELVCLEGMNAGLDMLIAMTGDVQIQGISVPGWYIPAENQFTRTESLYYPNGNFNTGVAHGIAGPLILMSHMARNGVIRPGQTEAIRKITDFLMKYKIKQEERSIWNGQIDFDEVKEGKPGEEKVFHRDAWCYGTPGISYALICASLVLQDKALTSFCIENLKTALSRSEGITSPTICHGMSGLYLIMDAVEHLMKATYFEKEKEQVKNKILGYYDEHIRFGFQDFEYDTQRKQMMGYDTCGFLEGAAGVAISLYSVEKKQKNIWRKAVLLV